MIIILTDADEEAFLDRLVPSTTHVCSCQKHAAEQTPEPEAILEVSGQHWTPEEIAVISRCSTPLQARREYRRAFPASDRSNSGIKNQYRALQKAAARETMEADAITPELRDECSEEHGVEVISLSAESEDPGYSEIPTETEWPDLSRIDPTLDGLRDEIADKPVPAPKESTGEEITLYAEKADQIAAVASGRQDDEDKLIAAASSSVAALAAYRERFPKSARTDSSITSRWYVLQPPMLPLKTRVRILQKHSPFSEKIGTIARRNIQTREYQVIPDGSSSRIWISEDLVEAIEGGSP